MPRRLRVECPGALYHVTARGNAGRRIYRDDGDRGRFLDLFQRAASTRRWLCLAYCLMENHYHLLVRTEEVGLARGMQWLNGTYAQGFNRAGGRSGHLFQGRYGAAMIVGEAHALEAARYIVLNPVRAGVCRHPADWVWSSFLATAGEVVAELPLVPQLVLERFGSGARARSSYRAFIAEGLSSSGRGE